MTRSEPLHRGECHERFANVTRSDDMVLAAERKEHVQIMALELTAALTREGFDVRSTLGSCIARIVSTSEDGPLRLRTTSLFSG